MSNASTSRPVKVVIGPVDHFVGARHTRRTWGAFIAMADGSTVPCGHEMHPDVAAAKKCGLRLWKRMAA